MRAASPTEVLPLDPELTIDQAEALRDIEAAFEPGETYLLTGNAGTGKTYLIQRPTRNMLAKMRRVILSVPTHNTVVVLRSLGQLQRTDYMRLAEHLESELG